MDYNKVYLMDCVEGMKQLADKTAQIIICDCPYNIGKDFKDEQIKMRDKIIEEMTIGYYKDLQHLKEMFLKKEK